MGGCCFSGSQMEDALQQSQIQKDDRVSGDKVWPFTEFFFSDLQTPTKNFSSYKGLLQNFGFVAVKKFKTTAWPGPSQFAEEAKRLGEIKHKRFVSLMGYCCDGDERLLVSEFLPNDSLAKRLFNEKSQTMEWSMRLRVAYCVAEALDYCSPLGFASYSNLSAYTVLLDEDCEARLSCFGLMEKTNDDQRTTGSVYPESVTYRFGTLLVNLLSGKQIPPSHVPEMINGKSVTELMDPNLEGNFSTEEATVVFDLASKCLQFENSESLKTQYLVATFEALQNKTQKEEASSSSQQVPTQISPLGEACSKMDLNAIHEILVNAEYDDDKEEDECSLDEWLLETRGLETVGKLGDEAFKEKDFKLAIHCYSKECGTPKCLREALFKQQKEAHLDVIQAREAYPDWPTGYFLYSAILTIVGMDKDAADILKEATRLEQAKDSTMPPDPTDMICESSSL